MKIEVGKRYIRRDGSVTPPLVTLDGLISDPETGYVFRDFDGHVYTDDDGPKDLVSEHIESRVTGSTNSDILEVDTTFPAGLDPFVTEGHAVSERKYMPEKLAAVYLTTEEDKTIDATLNARGNNYGDFHSQAAISQELSDVMAATPKWPELTPAQREALQMVQHKIARILNGNPRYLDSWVDIVGYAELGKRETERLVGK